MLGTHISVFRYLQLYIYIYTNSTHDWHWPWLDACLSIQISSKGQQNAASSISKRFVVRPLVIMKKFPQNSSDPTESQQRCWNFPTRSLTLALQIFVELLAVLIIYKPMGPVENITFNEGENAFKHLPLDADLFQ